MDNRKRTTGICIVLLIFLFFSSGVGQTIIRHKQRPITTLEGDIQFTYDDNIFLYSTKDLNDFKRSVRTYRFPFATSDDFITTLTGIVRIRLPKAVLRHRWTQVLTLRYRQHLFAVNRMKSYQVFSLNLSKHFTKQLGLGIGYSLLPRYLIRFYRDPTSAVTPPSYITCDFTEHLFTAEYRVKLPYHISLTPFYKYEICDYTKKFDFYDSKAWRFGFVARQVIAKQIELNSELEYKILDAVGPAPDISYEQLYWSLGTCIGLLKADNPRIGVSYGQERRKYVTDNPPTIDPFHRDRVDKISNLKLELKVRLSKDIIVRSIYELEMRKVTSPYKEDIDDIKDYNDNKFILGLNLRRF